MKPTLIIADDVKEIRAELHAMLQEEFDIVAEAATGAEAVEACKRHQPQLVLLDVVMPGMSGIEAARRISAAPGPHPKIIMLSGLADQNVVLQAMEAGASDYLIKPAEEKTLKEVLRDYMQSEASG